MRPLLRMSGWMLVALLLGGSAAALPLGTDFTYQGNLKQSGIPVNGTRSLRFSLWDAAGTGSQIGASQILANVPINNGLFTVQLNGGNEFGDDAFIGEARWLQIEICADPACGASTVLSPRLLITATPFALFAPPWRKIGSNASFTGGNVGIGLTSPGYPLEVGSSNHNGTVAYVHSDRPAGDNYALIGRASGDGANLNVGGHFSANGNGASLNVGASFSAAGASTNYAIQVPPDGGNVDIATFTKLGSDAPAIKIKTIEGVTGETACSFYPHGLNDRSIISVTVMIHTDYGWAPPFSNISVIGKWYWFVTDDYVQVCSEDCPLCANERVRIVIVYEELHLAAQEAQRK